MALKHVIIEGPDGSGKTHLKESILDTFPSMLPHVRAADSLKGPKLDTLANWVTDDLHELPNAGVSWVYDRHPIVSEPIYGWACRGGVPEMFAKSGWVNTVKMQLALQSLLVVCLPPLDRVIDNVKKSGNQQMQGVVDNIELIYGGYKHLKWPGAVLWYDYTTTFASHALSVIGSVTGRRGK